MNSSPKMNILDQTRVPSLNSAWRVIGVKSVADSLTDVAKAHTSLWTFRMSTCFVGMEGLDSGAGSRG